MLLNSASQLQLDLTGYAISTFLIILGFLFYFGFNNRIVYVGIPIIMMGFLSLSVQLDISGQIGFALFVGGLFFLSPQLYLKSKKNNILRIISFFFLSFAITFFVIAGLYMFYQGGPNSSLFSFVGQFINFVMFLLTLVELVRKFINFRSKRK